MSRLHLSRPPLAPLNKQFRTREPGSKTLDSLLSECCSSSSRRSHGTQMDDLQPELIAQILGRAGKSPLELCQLSELNRDWREAVACPDLWRRLELDAPEYTESDMKRISLYCGSTEEISIGRGTSNPRPLSTFYSSRWLYGLDHVLEKCSVNLRKVKMSTGCNIYAKDYRSGNFHTQFMKRITKHCPNLEECVIYYNSGRTGMRSDIPQWMGDFVAACPKVWSFQLWAPWGDCGGLTNTLLESMVSGWPTLETLEVAGDGITLNGFLTLRKSQTLKELVVNHITLGPSKRAATVKLPSDIDSLLPQGWAEQASTLTHLELAHSGCDLLDVQILRRLFPNLKELKIREYVDPANYIDDAQETAGLDEGEVLQHHLRQAELREGVLESPELNYLVTFIDL